METTTSITQKGTIIVVGNGMTGFKFCQRFVETGLGDRFNLVVFGEEPRPAYDRVHLTSYYTGTSADELLLAPANWYSENNIDLHTSKMVTDIDRAAKTITTNTGEILAYTHLVLATGSSAFVPPMPGTELDGVFVYRTIEDLDAIKKYAAHAKQAIVIGGGLLGLEAAKALYDDGVHTTVVERAPRLMVRQLDDQGAKLLKLKLESLDIKILVDKITQAFTGDKKVKELTFNDGSSIHTDLVVISAGIKPRDELARKTGLEVGKMGGIVVDSSMKTSDSNIFAIGECALSQGMIWGLVAPCYMMAEVAISQLLGGSEEFRGTDMSTKLKLIGTDVASFGDAFGSTENSRSIVLDNTSGGTYKKLVISEDGNYLLGGILVGDAADYNMLLQAYKNKIKLPASPESLLFSGSKGGGFKISMIDLPDDAVICSCENVTKGKLCAAIDEHGITSVGEIKKCTKAGTGCGGCTPVLDELLTASLKSKGIELKKTLCEHFGYTRQELVHLVKVEKIKSFVDLIQKHGTGHGCEICKPAVASILASTWNDMILKHDHIQDTNDRYLANIQKGGTYSVIPRIAGGEITPEKLSVISDVAKKYSLYCKITGGQRIDLLGAKVNDLPEIWEELIAAGFESGHAYGKALRTVKSCVGSTWCRFGLQDSVSFAIEVEERYKGFRAPHKLKSAVSGCIRECAEARSKDFGFIATDKGYNLYVCGNGGANPQHAALLANDIDKETCIKYVDRFLMFYMRTAEPLTRTSKWLSQLEGGIDYLKDVIINDTLGIAHELEADMQYMVDTYKCEWKEAVENPEIRKRFKHFINSDEHDTEVEFVEVRNQPAPQPWKK